MYNYNEIYQVYCKMVDLYNNFNKFTSGDFQIMMFTRYGKMKVDTVFSVLNFFVNYLKFFKTKKGKKNKIIVFSHKKMMNSFKFDEFMSKQNGSKNLQRLNKFLSKQRKDNVESSISIGDFGLEYTDSDSYDSESLDDSDSYSSASSSSLGSLSDFLEEPVTYVTISKKKKKIEEDEYSDSEEEENGESMIGNLLGGKTIEINYESFREFLFSRKCSETLYGEALRVGTNKYNKNEYYIESFVNEDTVYYILDDDKYTCTCPSFQYNHSKKGTFCKHGKLLTKVFFYLRSVFGHNTKFMDLEDLRNVYEGIVHIINDTFSE